MSLAGLFRVSVSQGRKTMDQFKNFMFYVFVFIFMFMFCCMKQSYTLDNVNITWFLWLNLCVMINDSFFKQVYL